MREISSFRRSSVLYLILVLGTAAILAGHWFAGPARADDPVRQARERFEASVGPLDPAAYRPAPVADEENGARWYFSGAAALELPEDDRELLSSLVGRLPTDWTPSEKAWLRQVVKREEAALELLHRGAAATASAFPPIPAEGPEWGALIDLHRASRLLLAAGLLELEEAVRTGRPGPLRSLDTLGSLAGDLLNQPEMLYLIFGTAAEGEYLLALHHATETAGVPPELLHALADRLPRRSATEAFSHSVALIAAEAANRAAGRQGEGAAEDEAAVLHELRRMAEASREPTVFADHLATTTSAPGNLGQVVTSLLMPNLWETLVKLQATESARQLAREAVALRLEAASRGGYPEDVALEPAPYTATIPEYRRFTDGTAVLANPAAAAAWAARISGHDLPDLPFHWHLPAV